MNQSPWIEQLRRTRPARVLDKDTSTDIVIVGGGISGMLTAYYLLRYTTKRITLLEGGKVAHGATGHNAGQVIAAFERPFRDLVTQFGLQPASDAMAAIEGSWVLLEELLRDTQLNVLVSFCTGYRGFSTEQQVLETLEDFEWRKKGGLVTAQLLVAEEEKEILAAIPASRKSFVSTVPKKDILALMETSDTAYVAAAPGRAANMNSAAFTEELAGYMLAHYPERFELYEQTFVASIDLEARGAEIETPKAKIKTKRVVLCTNGFEDLHIRSRGVDIDTKFHHAVHGTVGYMSGYLDPIDHPPAANAYFEKENMLKPYEPYFYMTRRPFLIDGKVKRNLICAGGPEVDLEDLAAYDRYHEIPETVMKDLDAFIHRAYSKAPKGKIDYRYRWHGLMGYTPNRIRMVGVEPCNANLLYNLGCNGIGIMPSFFGAKRISDIIGGKKIKPLIFDPQDMRCLIG